VSIVEIYSADMVKHQMPDYISALRGPIAKVFASAAPLPCLASLLQCSQQTVRNALVSGDKKALRATAKGYKVQRLSPQVYDAMASFLDVEIPVLSCAYVQEAGALQALRELVQGSGP